ncbi:MAG: hypothetical protein P1U67_11200 [Alcanivoracaceae bacterium]|nr:hypothetical protein [Alcanivoracaceae bacterium]
MEIENTSASNNPYQAPTANLQDALGSNMPQYYVVSVFKLLVMCIATMNLYLAYWFYRQWKALQPTMDKKIMPVPRGIFSVFFVKDLFNRIDEHRVDRQVAGRWNHASASTLFIAMVIAGYVIDRLVPEAEAFTWYDFLTFVPSGVIIAVMVPAQRAINSICDDPKGVGNQSFTAANWLWLLLGGMLWALIAIGVAVSINPTLFDTVG